MMGAIEKLFGQDVLWGCLAMLFEVSALFALYPAKKFVRNGRRFALIYGLALAALNYILCTCGSGENLGGLIFLLPYLGLMALAFFIDMDYLSLLAVVLFLPTLSTQTAYIIAPFSRMFGEEAQRWIVMIVPRLMLIPAFLYLKQFQIPGEERLPRGYSVPSCLLSLLAIGMVFADRENWNDNSPLMFCVMIFLAGFNFLLYYYFYRTSVDYTEKLQLQLKKKYLEDAVQYKENMEAMYQELRKLRHDSTNHFIILKEMIEDGKDEKALEYLQTLQENMDYGIYVSTVNASLNAILNAKCSLAASRGISVDTKILLPGQISLNDVDLCALMGNLMDNALEACSRCRNGEISVMISQKQGYLVIEIENTVSKNVFQENPQLETTKKDKTLHGLGIRIARDIAGKYGGEATFQERRGRFLALVTIPNLQKGR